MKVCSAPSALPPLLAYIVSSLTILLPVNLVELAPPVPTADQQSLLIAFSGWVLDYPVIYVLGTESSGGGNCLGGRELTVVEISIMIAGGS